MGGIIDETTSLTGNGKKSTYLGFITKTTSLTGNGNKFTFVFNIEYFRMFGLLAKFVMLFAGHWTTILFNQYPITDQPLNSPWDILFNGAESNFKIKETYIWHTFHFIHTCVYIDNNPAKTVAAFFIQVSVIPLVIFVFLSYQRINLQTDSKFDNLKACSFPLHVFLFCTFSYFFLCLVNSPMQDQELYDTYRAQRKFALHYIPFMIYQFAEMLMSLEQIKFLEAKDQMPFDFITKPRIRVYFYFMIALYLVYSAFIWSHILFGYGHGIWDSDPDDHPMGHMATNFIMFAYLMVADIIPAIFAYKDAQNTDNITIEFSMD